MAKYYLMNGQSGTSNSTYLLNGEYLLNNFNDISDIDLITMNISRKESYEILKKYNPKLEKDNIMYIASYPHSNNKIKTYAPIFNLNNSETEYYIENLTYFAKERKYKKEVGLKTQLDDDRKFNNYIRTLLYKILDNNNSSITNYESIISMKLKTILNDRYQVGKSTNEYINSNIYIFKQLLNHYTELRNLTLEYMLLKSKLKTDLRTFIKTKETWISNDMYEKDKIKYVEGEPFKEPNSYYQLELSDLFEDVPSVKKIIH